MRQDDVRYLSQQAMLRCPFAIMVPEHYRDDGSCLCDDPTHRQLIMIDQWGYTTEDFIAAGILEAETQPEVS